MAGGSAGPSQHTQGSQEAPRSQGLVQQAAQSQVGSLYRIADGTLAYKWIVAYATAGSFLLHSQVMSCWPSPHIEAEGRHVGLAGSSWTCAWFDAPITPAPSALPLQGSPAGATKASAAIPNERRLRQIQQSEMMGRVRALQGDQDGPAATTFVRSQVHAISMLLH